jgi:hypothetical protein
MPVMAASSAILEKSVLAVEVKRENPVSITAVAVDQQLPTALQQED